MKKPKLNEKWEMFKDENYYDFWAVRPKNDKEWDSPRLFHFADKVDATMFLKLVEKSYHAIKKD